MHALQPQAAESAVNRSLLLTPPRSRVGSAEALEQVRHFFFAGACRRWRPGQVSHDEATFQAKTLCETLQQWGASPEDLAPLLRMVRAIVVSNAVHRAETDREPHRASFAAALEPLKVRRQLLERFFEGHGMILRRQAPLEERAGRPRSHGPVVAPHRGPDARDADRQALPLRGLRVRGETSRSTWSLTCWSSTGGISAGSP